MLNKAHDKSNAKEKLQAAFRIIAILLGLLTGLTVLAGWLWLSRNSAGMGSNIVFRGLGTTENLVTKAYPNIDFTPIYPTLTSAEIDELQRNSSAIRYAYEPFVQFVPQPMRTRFVEITDHGTRRGEQAAPWPLDSAALNIFVFGGSTTLGYHVSNDQTVPAQLERNFRRHFGTTNLWCYNFGSGYFFSSQERARFAALLADNITPDAAVFIDGLNDFFQPGGVPQFTYDFYRYSAPTATVPDRMLFRDHKQFSDAQRLPLIKNVLGRYRRNVHLISAMAARAHIEVLFIGQPVPYMDYPLTNRSIHPFHDPSNESEDRLFTLGYPQFRALGKSGTLGDHFLWLGNLFVNASKPMYADRVHYSPLGSRLLAEKIVAECAARGFLQNHPKLGPSFRPQ